MAAPKLKDDKMDLENNIDLNILEDETRKNN